MADKQYLVMAWKRNDAAAKVIEPEENKSSRIEFGIPKTLEPGKKRYAGKGVLAKAKELSYDEMEAGRVKPGFAIVKQRQLKACQKARDVKVIGDVDALNNGLIRTREVPEVEEPEPVIDISAIQDESEVDADEKFDCEFCKRDAHFSRKGYIGHLKWHLGVLRKKGDLSEQDRETWDAINARMEELQDGQ